MCAAMGTLIVAWVTPVGVVPAEEMRLDNLDNVCANLQC